MYQQQHRAARTRMGVGSSTGTSKMADKCPLEPTPIGGEVTLRLAVRCGRIRYLSLGKTRTDCTRTSTAKGCRLFQTSLQPCVVCIALVIRRQVQEAAFRMCLSSLVFRFLLLPVLGWAVGGVICKLWGHNLKSRSSFGDTSHTKRHPRLDSCLQYPHEREFLMGILTIYWATQTRCAPAITDDNWFKGNCDRINAFHILIVFSFHCEFISLDHFWLLLHSR